MMTTAQSYAFGNVHHYDLIIEIIDAVEKLLAEESCVSRHKGDLPEDSDTDHLGQFTRARIQELSSSRFDQASTTFINEQGSLLRKNQTPIVNSAHKHFRK